MATNPQDQSQLVALESPKQLRRRLAESILLGLSILFAIPSILLFLDLGTKWLEVGLRFENVLFTVVELTVGISLAQKDIRQRIFRLKGWQKLSIAILLFLIMVPLTILILPSVAGILYEQGKKELNDGNRTIGIIELNLSLELQPGSFIAAILPLAFQTNPNYISSPAAQYLLGTAYEGLDNKNAEDHYEKSLDLNECYLYSYWRLGQLQIIEKDYFSAHSTVRDGIQILNGEMSPQCKSPMSNFKKEELNFWLHLTEARAYILEGKFEDSISNLNIVKDGLSQYPGITQSQFVTYFYWRIKASADKDPETPKDCSTINQLWPIMQQHYKNIQSPNDNTKDRYNEAERIQAKC